MSSANSKGTDTDVAMVVDRTATIENILCQVIERYCEPRKARFAFFWTVVLDSSIMPLGSKLRVSQAIANEVGCKLDHKSLHKVISLRNAFAHQPLGSHPVIVVKREPEPSEMHLQLQILTNTGKIVLKKRSDALSEFNAAFKSAKASLVHLLGAVKKQSDVDAA